MILFTVVHSPISTFYASLESLRAYSEQLQQEAFFSPGLKTVIRREEKMVVMPQVYSQQMENVLD